jgi:hypothetical protein
MMTKLVWALFGDIAAASIVRSLLPRWAFRAQAHFFSYSSFTNPFTSQVLQTETAFTPIFPPSRHTCIISSPRALRSPGLDRCQCQAS